MPDGISDQSSESGWTRSVAPDSTRHIKQAAQGFYARQTAVRDFGSEDSTFPDTFGYTRTHDGSYPSFVTCSTQTGRDGIARQCSSSRLWFDRKGSPPDLNRRQPALQSGALTKLHYAPEKLREIHYLSRSRHTPVCRLARHDTATKNSNPATTRQYTCPLL